MTRNDTNSSYQRLLAVSLALIMLVSAGSIAFMGGAAAQATDGGTFDGLIDTQTTVNGQVDVDSGDGDVLTIDDDDGNDVSVNDDGSVGTDNGNVNQSFAGVAVTPERVDTLFDVSADPSTAPADFLDESVQNLENSSTNGQYFPAIFVELAPQSEISQIDRRQGVDGSHDYIVIAPGNDTSGINGTVAPNVTTSNSSIDDEIVALSVDNDDSTSSDANILADGATFGAVIDSITGSSEGDVQNKNIDSFVYAAGTLEGASGTITELTLDDGSQERLLNNEKIELNPDSSDNSFFASINGTGTDAVSESALGQASDGDRIEVANGTYDQFENDSVTIDKDVTIAGAEEGNAAEDRVGSDPATTRVSDTDAETTLRFEVDVDNSSATVIDGVHIENDSTPNAVQLGDEATLNNTIVDYTGTDTAVDLTPASAPDVTIEDNAMIANNTDVFDGGEVGLNISDSVTDTSSLSVAGNLFVGFDTQVDGNANVDVGALVDAHDTQFDDDRAQAVVRANNTAVLDAAENIFGSIDDADSAAADGDILRVKNGTYNEAGTGNLTIATDNITVAADTSGAVIVDDLDLRSGTEVTVDDFEVQGDEGVLQSDASDDDPAVTLQELDLTGTGPDINISDAGSFTATVITFDDAGTDGIRVEDATSDVFIDQIDLVDGLTDGDAVHVQSTSESVDVRNVTVDSGNSDVVGVNVSNLSTSTDVETFINDNELTVDNGTGIDINATSSPSDEMNVTIDDNDIDGNQTLTGIRYNLPQANAVLVANNSIIGSNVAGDKDSVGINITSIRDQGITSGTPIGGVSSGDGPVFANNILTDHARIISVSATDSSGNGIGFDYDNFLNAEGADDPDLNNTVGTLVTDPTTQSGEIGSYADAYAGFESEGSANDALAAALGAGDISAHYLPGSVDEAVKLVDTINSSDVNTDLNDTDLQVYDPDVDPRVGDSDTYVEDQDTAVNFPDLDTLEIEGEGSTQSPTVKNARLVIDESEAINNHTVSNLALNNTDTANNPAIQITDGHNSQSTFENLDVTSTGAGLDVGADETDVNVITVTDTTFDVEADGIIFANGADDRDGYDIENVTLNGPGINESDTTGLNLSNVDKQGKDALPTDLTATGVEVNDFEEQVDLSDSLTNISDVDAEAVLDNEVEDEGLDSQVTLQFTDASFEHAVLVLEDDGTGNETLEDEEVLYGSIDKADANGVNDTANTREDIVDVRGTTTYIEDVNLADANNGTDRLLIRGPQNDTIADSDFRDDSSGADEAIIEGEVTLDADASDYRTLEITGFTVVNDDDTDTIDLDTSGGTLSDGVNVTNTAVSAANATGDGVGVDAGQVDAPITLDGVYIGDHDEVGQTDVGVNLTNADPDSVTIQDSVVNGNTEDGVLYSAGQDTVTITGSDVSSNGGAGVNASSNYAGTLTVTDSSSIDNNGIEGININSNGDELIINGSSTIENNDDDDEGILFNAGNTNLTVSNATVSNETEGIQIEDADSATSITRTTFEDNTDALVINDGGGAGDFQVRNNAFSGGTNAIVNDDETLNATLNHFNDVQGPEANATPDITGSENTIYDPYLTEDKTDQSVAATNETTEFSHDVILHGNNNVTTVGFPAQTAGQDLGEVINFSEVTTVYGFNRSSETFEGVDDLSGVGENTEVEAFDAFVVKNEQDDAAAAITYDSGDVNTEIARFEFQEGLNFVPPTAVGPANETLIANQYSDAVLQPFKLPGNLYGDGVETNASFAQSTSTPRQVIENSSDFGDVTVHPHAGYLVVVNNDESVEFTQTETITKPAPVTADTVAERTNQTAP